MGRRREKPQTPESAEDSLTRIRTGTERKTQVPSPLGKEHLHALNTVIEECTITEDMCTKCKDAGIDVEPEMLANAEQKQLAEKLKAAFFPHTA